MRIKRYIYIYIYIPMCRARYKWAPTYSALYLRLISGRTVERERRRMRSGEERERGWREGFIQHSLYTFIYLHMSLYTFICLHIPPKTFICLQISQYKSKYPILGKWGSTSNIKMVTTRAPGCPGPQIYLLSPATSKINTGHMRLCSDIPFWINRDAC